MKYFLSIFLLIINFSCSKKNSSNDESDFSTTNSNNKNQTTNDTENFKNLHQPLKTEELRAYFESEGYDSQRGKYVPLLTVYDNSNNIHCYIYLTQHMGHKNFFHGIDPLVEQVIAGVNKVYYEVETKHLLFEYMNLLYTEEWTDICKDVLEKIKISDGKKEHFKSWFFTLEEKLKKIYNNYISSLNNTNVRLFHANPEHIMSYLENFEEPDYYYSVESELDKLVLKYNKDDTGGLENPQYASDEEGHSKGMMRIYSFVMRCFQAWKRLNDTSLNYKEDVQNKYLGLYYISTIDHLINDAETNGEDTARHNMWIPEIIANKNNLYCFGGRHLFSNGNNSIYKQLINRGFKVELTQPRKILDETLSNININGQIFNDSIKSLKNYPAYYTAKLYHEMAKKMKNAGNLAISNALKAQMENYLQKAKQEKNKIGFTEQDLNDLKTI